MKIPAVELLDVYRFQKIQRDTNGVMIGKTPTPLVRVTFPGSVSPGIVVLDGLLLPVQPARKLCSVRTACALATQRPFVWLNLNVPNVEVNIIPGTAN